MRRRIMISNYLKNLYDNFDLVYLTSSTSQKNLAYNTSMDALEEIEAYYREILDSVNEGLSVCKHFELYFDVKLNVVRDQKISEFVYEDLNAKSNAVASGSLKNVFRDVCDGYGFVRKNNYYLRSGLKILESVMKKKIAGPRTIKKAVTVKSFLTLMKDKCEKNLSLLKSEKQMLGAFNTQNNFISK